MKKQLFSLIVFSVALGLLFISSCKKEDGDSKNDLTENIVGKYTNPNDYDLEIIVNKVDDSTVWLTLQNGYFDLTFSSTKMTSKTAFTLNKLSGATEYTGSGTVSGNNISVLLHEKITEQDGSVNEYDITFTASK